MAVVIKARVESTDFFGGDVEESRLKAASITGLDDAPGGFTRWIAANVCSAIPQSMAPITFGIATLSSGGVKAGALMMTAMFSAQLVGAVPITAVGRRFGISAFARALFAFRTLAFIALYLAVAYAAPLTVLVAGASLAGLVNGAIFGLLRAALNEVVISKNLPRALGIAATVNELVAVSGPILASAIGSVSLIAGVSFMAFASVLPIVVLPSITHCPQLKQARIPREPIPLKTAIWLLAAATEGACIGSIEVGAVALALRYELPPSAALLFTVPLCVASVLGGVWISIRNRRLTQRTVVILLVLYVIGMLVAALVPSASGAVAAAVLLGFFLAPLGMSLSLFMEDSLPTGRRAEGFALLRTFESLGVVAASAMIAFTSLMMVFIACAALALVTVVTIIALGNATSNLSH